MDWITGARVMIFISKTTEVGLMLSHYLPLKQLHLLITLNPDKALAGFLIQDCMYKCCTYAHRHTFNMHVSMVWN